MTLVKSRKYIKFGCGPRVSQIGIVLFFLLLGYCRLIAQNDQTTDVTITPVSPPPTIDWNAIREKLRDFFGPGGAFDPSKLVVDRPVIIGNNGEGEGHPAIALFFNVTAATSNYQQPSSPMESSYAINLFKKDESGELMDQGRLLGVTRIVNFASWYGDKFYDETNNQYASNPHEYWRNSAITVKAVDGTGKIVGTVHIFVAEEDKGAYQNVSLVDVDYDRQAVTYTWTTDTKMAWKVVQTEVAPVNRQQVSFYEPGHAVIRKIGLSWRVVDDDGKILGKVHLFDKGDDQGELLQLSLRPESDVGLLTWTTTKTEGARILKMPPLSTSNDDLDGDYPSKDNVIKYWWELLRQLGLEMWMVPLAATK